MWTTLTACLLRHAACVVPMQHVCCGDVYYIKGIDAVLHSIVTSVVLQVRQKAMQVAQAGRWQALVRTSMVQVLG